MAEKTEKLLDEIREKTLEGTILDVKTGDLIFTNHKCYFKFRYKALI